MKTPYPEFWPAQLEFLHADSDVNIDAWTYQGGFGSGKSFIGSLLGIMLAHKYPGCPGLVGAETLQQLKKTTIESYFEHFDAFEWKEGKQFRWNKSESLMTFPNGSKILFAGLEKYNRLRSLNIGWCHIEEMSLVEEAAFLLLLSRLRHPSMPRKRIFGTTNPEDSVGWIYDRFVKRGGKQIFKSPDGVESKINYRRVIAPTYENKALDWSYVASLMEAMDDESKKKYVDGLDGDAKKGAVCKTWSEANIDESAIYKPEHRLYLSCDFNVDPNCWVLAHRFQVGDFGEYHYFDEICMPATTTESAEEFVRRYGAHQNGVIITGDASGQNRSTQSDKFNQTNYTQILNVLSAAGMRNIALDLPAANPGVLERVDTWNSLLCSSTGVRRIKVNPRCRRLIYNMEKMRYIDGTNKIWEPSPANLKDDTTGQLKYYKHPFDAASYLTHRYDPIKRLSTPEARAKTQIVTRTFKA